MRTWALTALGRPAGIGEEEASGLMAHYRESRRLVKQLSAAREETEKYKAERHAAEARVTTLEAEVAALRREAATARRRCPRVRAV